MNILKLIERDIIDRFKNLDISKIDTCHFKYYIREKISKMDIVIFKNKKYIKILKNRFGNKEIRYK